MASQWEGKDEDALTEAIEEAETSGDVATVVSILGHSVSGTVMTVQTHCIPCWFESPDVYLL
jgi:hypothetical protein